MPARASPERECGLTALGERAAVNDQFAAGDENAQDDSTNKGEEVTSSLIPLHWPAARLRCLRSERLLVHFPPVVTLTRACAWNGRT